MLTARAPVPDDAPALAALMTPAVSRWLGHWPIPFTAAMAEERINQALAATAAGTALVEVLSRDGAVAGWIGGSGTPARVGFGYWLGELHQGHGLLRAFAPAWVARSRAQLRPQTLWAATQPGNLGSRRLLAACGLQPTRQQWMHVPARTRFEWVEVWERTSPPSLSR